MVRASLILGLFLIPCPLFAVGPPPVEQWIVVHPVSFTRTLAPLIQHRRDQGVRVVSVPTLDSARLKDRLRSLCLAHPGPSSILLAGSLDLVPALKGTVGRMKNHPSDAGYGCLSDSRLPTVPVGRFPARTQAELQAMVAKTLTLERSSAPGRWRRRLTVLAGIPDYNPVVDRLIETLAFSRFDRLHPSWSGRAIYTASSSRFRLPDRQLRPQTIDYLQQGQSLILYLGHSNAQGLYAGPDVPFLNRLDWSRLNLPHGGGVFFTFGCYGCQLQGPDGEGYGVHAIRNPNGPAAVLGSHGICFASMVQLGCEGLFSRAFAGPLPRTLGECWLATLKGIAQGKIDFLSYRMLDAVDGDPRIPQATQREEHLQMFVLLGDPALRLPDLADDIHLDEPTSVQPGKPLRITGTLPPRLHQARVQVSLERTPASQPVDLLPIPAQPGNEQDRILLANHHKANRFELTTHQVHAHKGQFSLQLEVPKTLPWTKLLLRVYAVNQTSEAQVVRRLQTHAAFPPKEVP